jgi:hypothetical protein
LKTSFQRVENKAFKQLTTRDLTASYVPLKMELVVPARDQKGTRCAIFAMPRLPPQL